MRDSEDNVSVLQGQRGGNVRSKQGSDQRACPVLVLAGMSLERTLDFRMCFCLAALGMAVIVGAGAVTGASSSSSEASSSA